MGSDLDLLSMGEFVRFVGSCGQDRDRLICLFILGMYIFPILVPPFLFNQQKQKKIVRGMIPSNDNHSNCIGHVHNTTPVLFPNEKLC